jgi:hypothetical protein
MYFDTNGCCTKRRRRRRKMRNQRERLIFGGTMRSLSAAGRLSGFFWRHTDKNSLKRFEAALGFFNFGGGSVGNFKINCSNKKKKTIIQKTRNGRRENRRVRSEEVKK